MSEVVPATRTLCMRQDDDRFYLALSTPFDARGVNFRRLGLIAEGSLVQRLEEGSQVFVYPRGEFEPEKLQAAENGLNDTDLFKERVILEAQQLGGRIAIDPSVELVEKRVPPAHDVGSMIIV
jgi:hypothetical protein